MFADVRSEAMIVWRLLFSKEHKPQPGLGLGIRQPHFVKCPS